MTTDPGTTTGAARFTVGADHPALPGHFPGAPVVPGVVILDHVLAAVGTGAGRARRLAWVKFARPLLPGQRAEVAWTRDGRHLRFTVTHEGQEIARGQLGSDVG